MWINLCPAVMKLICHNTDVMSNINTSHFILKLRVISNLSTVKADNAPLSYKFSPSRIYTFLSFKVRIK